MKGIGAILLSYNQPDIRKQIEVLREQKESHTRTKN